MLLLPSPITAYMQAVNARDTAAAQRCFTPHAHVHDDGRHYYGQAEIGAWLTSTQQTTPSRRKPRTPNLVPPKYWSGCV